MGGKRYAYSPVSLNMSYPDMTRSSCIDTRHQRRRLKALRLGSTLNRSVNGGKIASSRYPSRLTWATSRPILGVLELNRCANWRTWSIPRGRRSGYQATVARLGWAATHLGVGLPFFVFQLCFGGMLPQIE